MSKKDFSLFDANQVLFRVKYYVQNKFRDGCELKKTLQNRNHSNNYYFKNDTMANRWEYVNGLIITLVNIPVLQV